MARPPEGQVWPIWEDHSNEKTKGRMQRKARHSFVGFPGQGVISPRHWLGGPCVLMTKQKTAKLCFSWHCSQNPSILGVAPLLSRAGVSAARALYAGTPLWEGTGRRRTGQRETLGCTAVLAKGLSHPRGGLWSRLAFQSRSKSGTARADQAWAAGCPGEDMTLG